MLSPNRILFILPLFFLVGLLALLFTGLFKETASTAHPMLGQPLPHMSLPLLSDEITASRAPTPSKILKSNRFTEALLTDDYALINIFGSWCGACLIEHPLLMELKDFLPIYGIAWRDKVTDTARWLNKHGNPYRAVGVDHEGVFIANLGISGAPTSFLIDKNQNILFVLEGPITKQIIVSKILPFLAQNAKLQADTSSTPPL